MSQKRPFRLSPRQTHGNTCIQKSVLNYAAQDDTALQESYNRVKKNMMEYWTVSDINGHVKMQQCLGQIEAIAEKRKLLSKFKDDFYVLLRKEKYCA